MKIRIDELRNVTYENKKISFRIYLDESLHNFFRRKKILKLVNEINL